MTWQNNTLQRSTHDQRLMQKYSANFILMLLMCFKKVLKI